jgi:hypothetical protein
MEALALSWPTVSRKFNLLVIMTLTSAAFAGEQIVEIQQLIEVTL